MSSSRAFNQSTSPLCTCETGNKKKCHQLKIFVEITNLVTASSVRSVSFITLTSCVKTNSVRFLLAKIDTQNLVFINENMDNVNSLHTVDT